jgi:hypothetical protein
MKNTFNITILNTKRKLNDDDRIYYRRLLRPLLGLDSIISLCLEDNELYVEYDPNLFNIESFKAILLDIGFPLKERLTLSALQVSV